MLKELNEIVKNNIVEYKNEKEFLYYNGLDKHDFDRWSARGVSDDGFYYIMDCYPAGDATNDIYTKITNTRQIVDLLFSRIEDDDFSEIIKELNNEDNQNYKVDLNDKAEVLEQYFEFTRQIATFRVEHGKYKGGLMLVIIAD